MSNRKTYIDLFAGCGGLSLGLFNSNVWEGKFAIEKSTDAFQTLNHNLIERHNHFDWLSGVQNQIIKKFSPQLKSLRNQIDMVFGGNAISPTEMMETFRVEVA